MTAARALAVMAMLALLGPAAAQEAAPPAQPQPGTDLDAIVADLDSASVQSRIDASNRLTSGGFSLKQLEQKLAAPGLSPERRERLTAAAFRKFAAGPRGGIGIRWNPDPSSKGVVLDMVVQGVPAAEVLRSGDRILVADGQAVEGASQMPVGSSLRAVIVSHDPGDEIPMTISREGTTLNVTVKLVDFARVSPQQPQPDDLTVLMAWTRRLKSLAPPDAAIPQPLPSGLTNADWQNTYIDETDPGHGPTGEADGSRTRLVAGGEARGVANPLALQMAMPRPMANTRIVPPGPPTRGPIVVPQPADVGQAQQKLLLALTRRDNLVQRIKALNQRVINPAMPAAMRAQARSQIQTLTKELQACEAEIQKIQAQP
jgi:hypothetical protein